MTVYAAQQLQENYQDSLHKDMPEPSGANAGPSGANAVAARTNAAPAGANVKSTETQGNGNMPGKRLDDIPTLKSVVLSGDETVIHSARLRHNLDNLTSALAAESLSLQDEHIESEFIGETNLKVLLDEVIDTHVSRMRTEILALLEVHGARLGKLQD